MKAVGEEDEYLGETESWQDEQEKQVVAAVAIRVAMANQGGKQERNDADQEKLAAEPEQYGWQVPAKGNDQAFNQPGSGEIDQHAAVIAAHIDPVFGRGEQKATEHGPAETVEHFVSVPLGR